MAEKHNRMKAISKALAGQRSTHDRPLKIIFRCIGDPEIKHKPGDTWITWEPDDRIVSRRLNLDGTITEW